METKNVEGWVYYIDSEDEYLTIEIAVTDKLPHQLDAETYHRKNHVLIVCQGYYWHELEFINQDRTSNYLRTNYVTSSRSKTARVLHHGKAS